MPGVCLNTNRLRLPPAYHTHKSTIPSYFQSLHPSIPGSYLQWPQQQNPWTVWKMGSALVSRSVPQWPAPTNSQILNTCEQRRRHGYFDATFTHPTRILVSMTSASGKHVRGHGRWPTPQACLYFRIQTMPGFFLTA